MPKPKTIPPINEVKLHLDGCGIGAGCGVPVVVSGDTVVEFGVVVDGATVVVIGAK